MKRINNNKNVILAIIFGAYAGCTDSITWGFSVFILALVAYAVTDRLKAPIGEGPFDRFLGIPRRKSKD